jgi:Putative restriction endonuclease
MTTLAEAVKKYNSDIYKRSELYKGKVIVRRIPYVWSLHGVMETLLRNTMERHSRMTMCGTHWGGVGYLIDREIKRPTLRQASLSFVKVTSRYETEPVYSYPITPPDFVIELFNPPNDKNNQFPYPPNIENDNNDKYWVYKLEDYKRFGVGLLWMVDISKRCVYQYRQADWQPQTYDWNDQLDARDMLPDFRFRVRDMFELNLDTIFRYPQFDKFTLKTRLVNIGVDVNNLT